ncbi:SIR2 family protein [Bacillus thuringiensis]|uniref:SIR2 family protein n=1 Tax=Bacillus thuringiensis TaxID=1428 RepID=UPI0021586D2B|nr:SIR2 family protein [Bacillus thuringiensis]MEB8931948.1 SIR2 family protein [Bacillus cereus]MCR6790311.1 SIR2 family protein [Bacillus thuringiensis]MCR6826266.1 SIR2 family protein [Bacillus thuringiensis]MCR6832164.1 SIR2 family protein [Bacillus thuringiensis]MEB9325905.1 SIR2 family protein [Bacillus cereus]
MDEKLINKQEDINEIPDINKYKDIIKAAKTGNLIIFVGAGVSRLLGLPSWEDYAFKLLKNAEEEGVIDSELSKLLKKEKVDPKKILTISKMLMDEKGIIPRSAKEIFKFENTQKYKEVYEKLYSINAIYVTTNYDECLDILATPPSDSEGFISGMNLDAMNNLSEQTFKRKIIIDHTELLEAELKNGNVIHIHGSVKKEESMLVTLQDYLDRYGTISKDTHPEVSVFLDQIFNSNYVVLFMGYGLEENEILEYMLSKTKNPSHTLAHYMLFPIGDEKKKMTELYKKYYSSYGVELIPYDTSGKNYDQLIPIIDEWSKVLSKVSRDRDFISKTRQIDNILECDNAAFEVRSKSILKEIETSESLAIHFFKNVNGTRWLKKMKNENIFNPKNVPQPKKGNGGYRIPYWVQGDYLKKIVNQNDLSNEEISDILEIIKTISFYEDKEGKQIDNYRVWNLFVDVLEKIPNQYINIEFLNVINIWTNSIFSVDYISYNIAEKLINKFLYSADPEDIKKAEKIIECLVSLDLEKNKVKLGKSYFYKIFTNKKVQEISKSCSMKLIVKIMQQLKEYLGNPEKNDDFKYDGKPYTIKISKTEREYTIRIFDQDEMDYKMIIDKSEAENFTEQVTNWIYTKFSKDKLQTEIKNVIQSMYFEINYKEIYSLQMEMRGSYNKGFEFILYFFKDLCNYKKGPQMEQFLKKLINQEHLLFTKILLDVIGNDYVTYNKIFWDILEQKKDAIVFQNHLFEAELKVILEQLEELSNEQKSILLNLIEKGPNNNIIVESVDLWRQRRLKALSHIPSFETMYLELKKKTKVDPELSSKVKKTKARFLRISSPLTQEQLSSMSNNDIANFLKEFKGNKENGIATVPSLGQSIKEFSQNYPQQIIQGINSFINTDYYYTCQIIAGLEDACGSKQAIDWQKLLEFILSYINRPAFWEGETLINAVQKDANYRHVLIYICRLLIKGSENKEWAFKYNQYKKAKEILLIIFRKITDPEENNLGDNSISYFLNTVKGKALEALVNMSVLSKNMGWKNSWDNDFKLLYNRYLKRNVGEAYGLLGIKLVSLLNLDRSWTLDKINSIKIENEYWEAFFVGYIYYFGNINEDIYNLMGSHYEHAIEYPFKENDVKRKIANHIALDYLRGYEQDVEKNIYQKVMDTWNHELIKEIIFVFCRKTNYELNAYEKQRILDFWKEIHQKYKEYKPEKLNELDKDLISKTIPLIAILDDIDETNYELISKTINCLDNDFIQAIELLQKKIKENDPLDKRRLIGQLMKAMLSNLTSITLCPEEETKCLVEYLYTAGDNDLFDLANWICNTFTENEIDFLREIYQENNN